MPTSTQLLKRSDTESVDAPAPRTRLPTIVLIPTYRTAGEVVKVPHRIRVVLPTADILVVHDNRSDGRVAIADTVGASHRDRNIVVLPRSAAGGRTRCRQLLGRVRG